MVEAYGATLDTTPLDDATRQALRQFFEHTSAYVRGTDAAQPEHDELAARWVEQLALDDAVTAIAAGRDQEAIDHAPRFVSRLAVFAGLLARMLQSGRPALIRFVVDARSSATRHLRRAVMKGACFSITLQARGACRWWHRCSGSALTQGFEDSGGHAPLYRVANECASQTGPEVVGALVRAGANIGLVFNVCSVRVHEPRGRAFLGDLQEIQRPLIPHDIWIRAHWAFG